MKTEEALKELKEMKADGIVSDDAVDHAISVLKRIDEDKILDILFQERSKGEACNGGHSISIAQAKALMAYLEGDRNG